VLQNEKNVIHIVAEDLKDWIRTRALSCERLAG
jgi:hypothetical protein